MTNKDASPNRSLETTIPNGTGDSVTTKLLGGLTILVLEDEFLIAMDVEHLCLEHGATAVAIAGNLAEAPTAFDFDAAVVDLMLGGQSTLDYASELRKRGIPFVFASGYGDREDLTARFPEVSVVAKPYAGNDLVEALAAAAARSSPPRL
jgi:CheY-like chemotaxis protein